MKIHSLAGLILSTCFGRKKGEEVAVICDMPLAPLARDFYEGVCREGAQATFHQFAPGKMHGEEPPAVIARVLAAADIALLFTSMSLSHTQARKDACKKYGTRVASLPGITRRSAVRSLPVDYGLLRKECASLARKMTGAHRVEVSTPAGTRLTMSVKGRAALCDDGIYAEKGAFGNLPAGEVCLAPVEGTAEGLLVVDGSAPFRGVLKKPLRITIRGGHAVKPPLKEMIPLYKRWGRAVLNVAEFGIGLNPNARLHGIVLEDEKVKGTGHIAFGNNRSFGGRVQCPCHLDCVFRNPAVFLDGKKITLP